MSGTPENQQPQRPNRTPAPQKVACGLNVALDCLLFILLQYMVSCVTLSFWMPPAARRHFVQFGLYAKFFHDMDKRLGRVLARPGVGVIDVGGGDVCPGGLGGYFPWGRRRCVCLGWLTQPKALHCSFRSYYLYLLSTRGVYL